MIQMLSGTRPAMYAVAELAARSRREDEGPARETGEREATARF
jgi:hypothetical protein